jgi:hypothetical protein
MPSMIPTSALRLRPPEGAAATAAAGLAAAGEAGVDDAPGSNGGLGDSPSADAEAEDEDEDEAPEEEDKADAENEDNAAPDGDAAAGMAATGELTDEAAEFLCAELIADRAAGEEPEMEAGPAGGAGPTG